MTLAEFNKILKKAKMPVAFRQFKSAQELPYMVYLTNGENGFKADGMRYSKTTNIRIELYTKDKNPATETVLEKVLDEADIFYEKSDEIYIESEKMYEIIYETEI